MTTDPKLPTTLDENEMARIAGHGRDVDGAAPKHVQAEVGVPSAEHGAYGMVREGSKEAAGLTERQIRGVDPEPAEPVEPPDISPAVSPQPSHIDRPQNPLPGNPPVMPEPTPPETKPHPGL